MTLLFVGACRKWITLRQIVFFFKDVYHKECCEKFTNLQECKLDISGHIRFFKIEPANLHDEHQLILTSERLFFPNIDEDFDAGKIQICETHRKELGERWKRQGKTCQYQGHTSSRLCYL